MWKPIFPFFEKAFLLNSRVEIVTVRKVGYRLEEPSC